MTALQPAGTAERAGQLFAELRAAKRELEKRGIPEIIAEIHRDRLWLSLNYPTFEAACDALLGGWRLQPPRNERPQVVADLRAEGMSTRAIGTALGVDEKTVRNDLKSGAEYSAPDPTPVTGLDGKTYTPRVTPIDYGLVEDTWPTPVDAGEVPDDEVPEMEAHLRGIIDGSAAMRAANLRRDFAKWLNTALSLHTFDPTEMAAIYPERAADIAHAKSLLDRWSDEFTDASQTLRVIPGEAR